MSDKMAFSEKEIKLICTLITLNKAQLDIDWKLAAEILGYQNAKSARDTWGNLRRNKKHLFEVATSTGSKETTAPEAKDTPTPKGKKRKAESKVDDSVAKSVKSESVV